MAKDLLKFRPAQFKIWKTGAGLVEYSAWNPATGKLERKRVKLNHIPPNVRKAYGQKLAAEINRKLFDGWNPFLEQETPRSFHLLKDALRLYLQDREASGLRPASLVSYRSQVGMFLEYLERSGQGGVFCISFGRDQAAEFMRHTLLERRVSPQTYNNVLIMFRGVWNWLQQQGFARDNVFAHLPRKKVAGKSRTILQGPELDRLFDQMAAADLRLYYAARLIFFCLIRPKELTFLTPELFDYQKQTITVPAHASKSGRVSVKTVPDVILGEITTLFLQCPAGWFVFGHKAEPSEAQGNTRQLRYRWLRFRKSHPVPETFKLYSFKDSGIVKMYTDNIPQDVIMKQADHTKAEITRVYADHINQEGLEKLRGFGD